MVDVARHARHLSLPEVGLEGQRRLTASSVLIVGAGGLGSPRCALPCSRRGGALGSHRQRCGGTQQPSTPNPSLNQRRWHAKVLSAQASLRALDPGVVVEAYHERLNPNNVLDRLAGWDLVIDGTDNLPTRYLIDDACSLLGLPWVYGSVFRFEGQVSLFNFNGGPCYRDLFPDPPPAEAVLRAQKPVCLAFCPA